MHWFSILRIIFSIKIFIFTVAALGLAGSLIAVETSLFDGRADAGSGLALALGLITLIVVIAMLVINNVRTGAVTSLIAVELGWTSGLGLLWLITGAVNASVFSPGTAAVSFLNWVVLWAWAILLLVFTLTANQRVGAEGQLWMRPTSELFRPVNPAMPGVGYSMQPPAATGMTTSPQFEKDAQMYGHPAQPQPLQPQYSGFTAPTPVGTPGHGGQMV